MKKNENQERYLDGLLLRGIVDTRRLAGVANAKKLPNGEFGFCLMCLKQKDRTSRKDRQRE